LQNSSAYPKTINLNIENSGNGKQKISYSSEKRSNFCVDHLYSCPCRIFICTAISRRTRFPHEALAMGAALAFMGSIIWSTIWWIEIEGRKMIRHCLRPDLMRAVFVLAVLCSIVGIFRVNYVLVSAAFFSVFLFPFLDWLDISIKIPQNATSTLLFAILQIVVLSLISILIDWII